MGPIIRRGPTIRPALNHDGVTSNDYQVDVDCGYGARQIDLGLDPPELSCYKHTKLPFIPFVACKAPPPRDCPRTGPDVGGTHATTTIAIIIKNLRVSWDFRG